MSSGRVVPAIPDIQAIADPQVRQVIAALVDGWQVRNADKGDGEHKFLTKADLKALAGDDNFKAIFTNEPRSGGANAATGVRRQSVGSILLDLQSEIAGGRLSVYLAQTIKDIRRPDTGLLARVGRAETFLTEEIENRTNADNAILLVTNTQFATVNQNVAAIQTQQNTLANSFAAQADLIVTVQSRLDNIGGVSMEQRFQTLINADNHILAQYTVKADLNGYVVGFGFIAEDNGNGPSSQFLVRADTFAIGMPGLNSQIPFIVRTVNWIDSYGRPKPPGIYSDAAFITNLTVDTADILDAAVDTLKIRNQAVTFPVSAQSGGGTVGPSGMAVVSAGLAASGAPVHVIATCSAQFTGSDGHALVAQLLVDGVAFASSAVTLTAQSTSHVIAVSGMTNPFAGARTFSMYLSTDNGQNCEVFSCSILVLECKR